MRHGIVLRRQPRDGLEHAMKVAGAPSDRLGEVVQGLLSLALLDQAASLRDDRCIFSLDRNSVRVAAFARAKTGRLGGCERFVQLDIPAVRGPRRTGWPAVNPGRRHRIPEAAIRRLVAGDDTGPARIIGHFGRPAWLWPFEGHGHVGSLRRGCCRAIMPPHGAHHTPVLAFKSNWAACEGRGLGGIHLDGRSGTAWPPGSCGWWPRFQARMPLLVAA